MKELLKFVPWWLWGILVVMGVLLFTSCAMADEIDLEIIKQIESGGDPHAYNEKSGATGLYQITYPCLEDYNIFGKNLHNRCDDCIAYSYVSYDLKMDDMYDPYRNFLVANWYMNTRIPQLLKRFKHEDTIENRLISYNCGVGCVGKKLLPETRRYIYKYRRLQ